MARTYKNIPFRKKVRSIRFDRDTKTTIRNDVLKMLDFEVEENDKTLISVDRIYVSSGVQY